MMLRAYSWLSSQVSLKARLRGPDRVQGIEPRLIMCKVGNPTHYTIGQDFIVLVRNILQSP